MNNDYLWDRTGEPDAEVQELEEVLGTLRYQPQPLSLPEDVQMKDSRKWYPLLAIAATIALVALALGIWLRVQPRQPAQPDRFANKNSNTEEPQVVAPKDSPSPQLLKSPEPKEVIPNAPRTPSHNRSTLARHLNRTRPSRQEEQMNAANRAEAEAAKQQLMLALRVVSAKLNFAQRKAVPGNNNIRYQHKVG
jgi:hypothetical protein